MRDDHIDLCGQIDFTRTEAMPLLARDAHFSFACNGCGDCCRGREDIVLSGFDLWRIAARLRLPPHLLDAKRFDLNRKSPLEFRLWNLYRCFLFSLKHRPRNLLSLKISRRFLPKKCRTPRQNLSFKHDRNPRLHPRLYRILRLIWWMPFRKCRFLSQKKAHQRFFWFCLLLSLQLHCSAAFSSGKKSR